MDAERSAVLDPSDELTPCPNCGSTEGTPGDYRWREYQGEPPHGGVVEFVINGCSECLGPAERG